MYLVQCVLQHITITDKKRYLLLLSTCALVTPGGKPKITTLSSQDLVGYRAVSMYLHEKKGETVIQCITVTQTAKVLSFNAYAAS